MNNHTSHNCNFYFYGLNITPSGLSVTWLNDFARLTWTDFYCGSVNYEIWESKNNEPFVLAGESLIGATSFNAYTWQNASMRFKIRAKQIDAVSDFSNIVSIQTPLVFKTDQTIPGAVVFQNIDINAPGTINLNWGDGNNVNLVGANINVTNIYVGALNPYFITLSGDLNLISNLQHFNDVNSYGSMEKWLLPVNLFTFHWYSHAMTGNVSYMLSHLPVGIGVFHIGNNQLTGDISNCPIPISLYDFHCSTNLLTGSLKGWRVTVIQQHMIGGGNLFTSLPRGQFQAMTIYNFTTCNVNSDECSQFLVDLNNYFTGAIVPTQDCEYTISGVGMGAVNSFGLYAKALIQAKFIAAGFVATINNN